ncbi:MAG: DNRLRE domain-containing protein [Gammaproteobacteria bacterium]|nr:DNRLRE domain-containing protein [Gammaproteobacteria bacterium]
MNKFLNLLSLVVVLATTTAIDAAEFTDDNNGMRCAYYNSGFKLQWRQRGGDWSDAAGVAYGDTPYAVAAVQNQRNKMQAIDWDVTELVRYWQNGGETPGGFYLRKLSQDAKSSAQFRSRNFKDSAAHPSLVIEWADGRTTHLQATADSTMTCTSVGALGEGNRITVGEQASIALVFPFVPEPGAVVRRARLQLHSHKQYGPATEVGVFRLTIPADTEQDPQAGFAARFPRDEGIYQHPAVVFATGFESSDWYEEWSASREPASAEPVSEDAANHFAPLSGKALRVTIEQGKKGGLNLLYRFREKTGAEPDAMHFRYYVRLGESWKPLVSGKMPGFAGTYNRAGWGGRRSDGVNGWSARGAYKVASSAQGDAYALGSYIYHADSSTKFGDLVGWNLGNTGLIEKNRWYSVEQYVRLNTPGKADGEVKAWLDGVLVYQRRGLRFRDIPDLHIETLWMNVYHGGVDAAPSDLNLFIDNVVIAREYIGPAAGLGEP